MTPHTIPNHALSISQEAEATSTGLDDHGNESGFILPTVLIVLVIVTILAVTTMTVAVRSSSSVTRDNNVKAALAAAEAGLQMATYRINAAKPGPSECIATTEVKGVPTNESKEPKETGTCEGSETLGNGARYVYYASIGLTKGECAGVAIVQSTNIVKRCITAEGIVNNVSPHTRAQTLIESEVGASLFAIKGILGLEEVLVNGAVKATSVVASNKKIKGEGSAAFEKGYELCPGGTFTPAAGTERNKSGVTIGGIGGTASNPSLEVTRSSGCPIVQELPTAHPTAAENEDIRITDHEDKDSEQQPGESWNKLEFSGSPNYELTLKSSPNVLEIGNPLGTSPTKYYFCNFTDNGELKIAKGAKVEIFIGSVASGCPKSTGTFSVTGAGKITNPNGAAALLIEVAGPGPVEIGNSGTARADIYAPEAEVKMSGAGTFTGSMVGKKVHLEAGSFNTPEVEESIIIGGSGAGSYLRKAWTQCSSGSGVASAC